MNCFMGYNPLVAKDVKITTWIKEFDGDEPVSPIFPAEGDCFIVFATDEDATTHNALSSKTYKDGEWVDAESGGGGGGGDLSTAEVTLVVADGHSSFGLNCDSGDEGGYIGNFLTDGEFFGYSYVGSDTSPKTFKLVYVGDSINVIAYSVVTSATGAVTYEDSGIVTISGDCTITGYADD